MNRSAPEPDEVRLAVLPTVQRLGEGVREDLDLRVDADCRHVGRVDPGRAGRGDRVAGPVAVVAGVWDDHVVQHGQEQVTDAPRTQKVRGGLWLDVECALATESGVGDVVLQDLRTASDGRGSAAWRQVHNAPAVLEVVVRVARGLRLESRAELRPDRFRRRALQEPGGAAFEVALLESP